MTLVLNGTTGVSAVDGSASTPAIQGNDSNTGMFFPAADTIAFATAGTEDMRIDPSGQIGVGMTPNAGQGTLQTNRSISGGGPVTSGTSDPNQVAMISGGSVQFSYGAYPSGTGWIQMRSTSSFAVNYDIALQPNGGNVGIGTSSPNAKVDAYAASNFVGVRASSGSNFLTLYANSSGTQSGLYTDNANPILFWNSGTERARIDSSGNLLVGTTSPNNTSSIGVTIDPAGGAGFTTSNTGTQYPCAFRRGGNLVGTISTSTTATAYNTSSDYRLKHDIAPMTGALAKVAALKPCTYKWNADDSDGEGFIAHELAEVVPQCVTGEKDAVDADGNPVYQGIDTSFLVATLTAAIQELKAIVDQQAVEIAALKGQA